MYLEYWNKNSPIHSSLIKSHTKKANNSVIVLTLKYRFVTIYYNATIYNALFCILFFRLESRTLQTQSIQLKSYQTKSHLAIVYLLIHVFSLTPLPPLFK